MQVLCVVYSRRSLKPPCRRFSLSLSVCGRWSHVCGEADTEAWLCCLCWPEGSLFAVINCSELPLPGVFLISSKSCCVSEEVTQREEHPTVGRWLWVTWGVRCGEKSTQYPSSSGVAWLLLPFLHVFVLQSKDLMVWQCLGLCTFQRNGDSNVDPSASSCPFWSCHETSIPAFPSILNILELTIHIYPSCPETWLPCH